MYETAERVEAEYDDEALHSRRDLVEARLVRWSLEDLGGELGTPEGRTG